MQSRNEFLDDISATLGGYVAEEMVFGDVTTGPSNDLAVLTALARDMVARYGMSDSIGPVAFSAERNYAGETTYSEAVAGKIDAEVSRIISEAKKRAIEVLTTHRKALDAIANKLIEVETIEREEFEKLLILNGITPKVRDEEEAVA